MLSFRAQLVLVLTALLLVFAIAAGLATVATLDRSLQEDGLRDVRQASDARRDLIVNHFTLNRQRASALLESIASNCDQSGHVNSACASDAIDDWARRDHVRYAVLSFPKSRTIQRGTPQPLDPALYRNENGLSSVVKVSDAWSGGKLTAVFDGTSLETAATAPFRAGAGGSVALLNSEGQPLVPLRESAETVAAMAQYCRERKDPGVIHTDGSRTLLAASVLPAGQGCVVAQVPVAELLAPAVRLRRRFSLMVAVFLVVAGGSAFVLAYVMSRPLVALTRRVETMSRGDFGSVVPRGGPSEIRTFADAFARMAHSLKQSHEALQQNEEKLRLSYRAAHLWPWEASIIRGYFRWIDFSGEQPVVHEEPLETVIERVHPEDRDFVLRTLDATELEGKFHLEFRYLKPDGQTIWIASRGERIRRAAGPALIGVNLDVTQRRQLDEIERDRERLAASAHIAAELAHEINNPLAAVAGALYLLKSTRAGTPEYAHCIDIAKDATDRITHIARQLLGLYQRAEGAERVDMSRIVREVLDMYRDQARAQQVKLTADLPGEAPLTGHVTELRTAIANVVSNALANVSLDGHVVVRVRRSRERSMGRDGIRVTISDNGSGIAPENRRRVFEAFFSTSQQRGTGLGLWVTSNIVRKHYGSIRVRSAQAGERPGTTVSIFLPRLDAEETSRLGAASRAVA